MVIIPDSSDAVCVLKLYQQRFNEKSKSFSTINEYLQTVLLSVFLCETKVTEQTEKRTAI